LQEFEEITNGRGRYIGFCRNFSWSLPGVVRTAIAAERSAAISIYDLDNPLLSLGSGSLQTFPGKAEWTVPSLNSCNSLNFSNSFFFDPIRALGLTFDRNFINHRG
jgi:hypothetical protein